MLLANGLSTFFIKVKSIFNDGSRSLPRKPPDCTILENWVFENFMLDEEVLNHWSVESWSIFDERFIIASVSFFIPDFNLPNCEWDNFTFTTLFC